MISKDPVINGIKIKRSNQIKSDLILSSLYNPRVRGAKPHNPNITIVDHALNLSPPIYPR